MKPTKQEYEKIYQQASKSSRSYRNIPMAFLVGGGICAFGELLFTFFTGQGFEETAARGLVSCTLIFLGVLLTGLKVYERIAVHAGAGTLVPITGFANAISSPAIEFKTEGLILGTCVKMFTISGPVITLGVTASVIYGLILFFWRGGA